MAPQACQIFVGWAATALANDLAVPAGVVVDVDYAELGTSVYAALDQPIVGLEIGAVECAAQLVVDEILPGDGQTERIEAVVIDEMPESRK